MFEYASAARTYAFLPAMASPNWPRSHSESIPWEQCVGGCLLQGCKWLVEKTSDQEQEGFRINGGANQGPPTRLRAARLQTQPQHITAG